MEQRGGPGDERLLYPDYTRSLVNLTASLLRDAGAETDHPPLAELPPESLAPFRHVVLFVLDGLGSVLLRRHADCLPFLAAARLVPLTSVFPSTTSAALGSLLTGRTPLEHGILGWTLYFKEFHRFIDYLPGRDHVNGQGWPEGRQEFYDLMSTGNLFARMAQGGKRESLYYFLPRSVASGGFSRREAGPSVRVPARSFSQLCRRVARTLLRDGRTRSFSFAYHVQPDSLAHHNGCGSPKVRRALRAIDQALEALAAQLAGTGTCLLVTADHGLLDIGTPYRLEEDPSLYRTLILPAFPESRFVSFFVKPHREGEFLAAFERYRSEFLLLPREEFLRSGLLGPGTPHPKVDDFIGSYVAIATADRSLKTTLRLRNRPEAHFLAHHAGLTRAEMSVPLIRIDLA